MRHSTAPMGGHRSPVVLLTTIVALLYGCGGTPTENDQPTDIALSAPSAGFLGTEGGADPAAQAVDVTADGPGAIVGLAASVAYAAGEPQGWLAAGLSATTAPATLTLEPSVAGLPAGLYGATVTVTGSGTASETLAVALVLTQSSPPTIVITSPTRAAMLQEGTLDPTDIQVTGEVCHPTVPITSLVVLGEDVPVAGDQLCEPFDVMQSSSWGLSTVTIRAENAFGRSAEAVQSYLRSPTYFPFAQSQMQSALPASKVSQAVLAHLEQPAIDDQFRGTLANPDADELATMLWLTLAQTDINGEIPNPLVRTPANAGANVFYDCIFDRTNPATGIRINRGTASWGTPTVDYVYAVDGGLYARLTVSDVVVPLTVLAWFDGGCLLPNLSASRTGTVSLTTGRVTGTWNVSLSPGGTANVTAESVSTSITGLQVDIDWAALDFLGLGGLVDDAANQLIAAFNSSIETALGDMVQNAAPSIIAGFVNSFTIAQPRVLNGAGTGSVSKLDRIFATGPTNSGSLELGLLTQIWPVDVPSGPDPAFGAIQANGSLPTFPSVGYDVGFALKDDLLNQFLWSVWREGAFDIPDLAAYTGEAYPGLQGSVSVMLPPVVMPSSDGHMLAVGWGDLAVSLTVDRSVFGLPGFLAGDPFAVDAYVSGVVGLDLALDDATYQLTVTDLVSSLDVQIDTDAPIDRDALASAVEQALGDLLAKLVPEAFAAMTVPQIDSGNLPGLPADHVVRVGNATVERDGRYIRLTGDVVTN